MYNILNKNTYMRKKVNTTNEKSHYEIAVGFLLKNV